MISLSVLSVLSSKIGKVRVFGKYSLFSLFYSSDKIRHLQTKKPFFLFLSGVVWYVSGLYSLILIEFVEYGRFRQTRQKKSGSMGVFPSFDYVIRKKNQPIDTMSGSDSE